MTSSVGLGVSQYQSLNFSNVASRIFSKTDTNSDGKISLDEFQSVGQNVPAGANSSADSDRTSLFQKIDADGDGSVSKGELTSYGQKLTDQLQSAMLQLQELSGGKHGHHHHGEAAQASPTADSGQASGSVDSLFKAADGNGDGAISKDELQAFADQASSSQTTGTADPLQGLMQSAAGQPAQGPEHHHGHGHHFGGSSGSAPISFSMLDPTSSTISSASSDSASGSSVASSIAASAYANSQSLGNNVIESLLASMS